MKLIAHGCGPTLYPANTILSAEEALRQGADLVELDVHFTADGCPAVCRDRNLLREFGEDADCGGITAEKFLSLRFVRRPAFAPHLLAHFLESGTSPLLLHLGDGVPEEVCALIKEYGYTDKVVLGVTDCASVARAKKLLPGVRVLGFVPCPEKIEAFAGAGADAVLLWESWLTGENVRRVKESTAQLWVMSGGSETGCPAGQPGVENLCRIFSLEPDAVLVNDIPFARAVYEEY